MVLLCVFKGPWSDYKFRQRTHSDMYKDHKKGAERISLLLTSQSTPKVDSRVNLITLHKHFNDVFSQEIICSYSIAAIMCTT